MPRGIGQLLEQTFPTINRVGGDKSMISPMTGGKEKSRLGPTILVWYLGRVLINPPCRLYSPEAGIAG
jgi:hypothetical protein